jgi:hypothetical protein
MVVSSAFKELSAVLARLESRGAEVQHAAIDEDLTGSDGAVTAELSVGVPLLDDAAASDAVSVAAVDATVEDGQVAVDLTVTVSGDVVPPDTPGLGATDAGGGTDAQAVPAYKDPDALREAYERHETFPEMTAALGVDVTSETVRRHMVKYGIHDPDDVASGHAVAADDRDPQADDADSVGRQEPAGGSDAAATDETATREEATDGTSSTEDSASQSEPVAGNAVTDGGNTTVAGTARTASPCASTAVTDLLAERDGPSGAPGRAGSELADAVTVGGLTEAINRSQTVHEVAHEIGVGQSAAREFLQAFDLIHFVSHPLAADQVTLSPDEVKRRLAPASQ